MIAGQLRVNVKRAVLAQAQTPTRASLRGAGTMIFYT